MPELPSEVVDLLARQDGVASRSQLLGLGVTREVWRWNAGRSWRLLLPNVVLLSRSDPRPRQRLVAALLWAGPDAVLAGPTAARLHGITSADDGGTIRLLVPRSGSDREAGFARVRRTALRDDGVVVRGPLRMASAARAAVDAASTTRSRSDALAILVEAVQRRAASLDDVAEWVHRTRAEPGGQVREALAAAASGAWSRPEAGIARLMATSAVLPEAWLNPELESPTGEPLLTPDAWLDDVGMAVLVHSHLHHATGDDWDDTVDADGGLTAEGVVVVGVTPRRIAREPDRVLRRLEATYAVARDRPRPAVRATPHNPWQRHAA